MLEYVVDYLGFREEHWELGDQDDWEPRPYPENKYRKEGKKTVAAEPFNITVTGHCNTRAQEGWRLHSMVPNAENRSPMGAYVTMWGAWLVFERVRP